MAPSLGGRRPGTRPMPPSLGGRRPGTRPMAPSLGGRRPGTRPMPPSLGGHRPGTRPMAPSLGGRRPGTRPMAPSLGERHPRTRPMAPSLGGRRPGTRPMAPSLGDGASGRILRLQPTIGRISSAGPSPLRLAGSRDGGDRQYLGIARQLLTSPADLAEGLRVADQGVEPVQDAQPCREVHRSRSETIVQIDGCEWERRFRGVHIASRLRRVLHSRRDLGDLVRGYLPRNGRILGDERDNGLQEADLRGFRS